MNLQAASDTNGSNANRANITSPVPIKKIQTDHSSVATGVSTGGRRSPALSPQSPGKSQPPLLVYLRTCTKGDERVRDTMKQNTHRQKVTKEEVSRAVTHTYIFLKGSSVELQADQGGGVKTSASGRIRQTTWSFGASFLKGLDLRALVSLTQYSGKPYRAEGTRSEQQILKNLPFHPVNEFWKGVRRTLPGTLLRVT